MSKKKILQIPWIDQTRAWPTGCESVSAVMLLRHLGFDISVDDFIRNYLPCRPFSEKEGVLTGPDPAVAFAGSPYDPDAMGCYAAVIVKALTSFFQDASSGQEPVWQAEDLTGVPMEELCSRYLDRGLPVIFWACTKMKEPVAGPSWMLEDGRTWFTWISNEHCMLLVGYDDQNYYFNDPQAGHGCIAYPKGLTEERHRDQYQMAAAAFRKEYQQHAHYCQ